MWKRLELWLKEALQCFKQNLMRHSDENVKDQKPLETWAVKIRFMWFHRGASTLLETGLEATGIPFQQRTV